jgi:hypothetical protein
MCFRSEDHTTDFSDADCERMVALLVCFFCKHPRLAPDLRSSERGAEAGNLNASGTHLTAVNKIPG